jgi:hypothetical protein
MEAVRLAVVREVRDQTPQVEGARDRVLFGEAAAPPAAFVPLLERRGDLVELGGGIVHGVDPGSLWAIRPAGTLRPDGGEALGLVRIDTARAARSSGAIVEERQPILPGARAFAHAHSPRWLRLAVRLAHGEPEQPDGIALAAALARSPLLVPAADDDAEAVSIAAAAPEAPQVEGQLPAIEVAEPSWIVLSAEGELLLPPLARRGPDAVGELLRGLEDLARSSNLLALAPATADEEACDAAALAVELLRRRGDEPYQVAEADAGGEIVYQDGDRLALRVTHHAGRPLYLHVLDIGHLGAISPVYPVPGANQALAAGVALEIGTRPGESLTVRLHPGLAAIASATGRQRCEGREVLKILLTTEDAALRGGPPPQRGGRRAGSRLAALLDQALAGTSTRGAVAAAPGDRWTARTLTFLVRAAGDSGRG